MSGCWKRRASRDRVSNFCGSSWLRLKDESAQLRVGEGARRQLGAGAQVAWVLIYVLCAATKVREHIFDDGRFVFVILFFLKSLPTSVGTKRRCVVLFLFCLWTFKDWFMKEKRSRRARDFLFPFLFWVFLALERLKSCKGSRGKLETGFCLVSFAQVCAPGRKM